MKWCSRCKKDREGVSFPKDRSRKDGLSTRCGECVKEMHREYYQRNKVAILDKMRLQKRKKDPVVQRRGLLKCRTGLSVAQYVSLFIGQGERCAICSCGVDNSRNNGNKHLAVDHNHNTGAIRGLLCIRCNSAIGYLNDDPFLVQRALEYLQRYEGAICD